MSNRTSLASVLFGLTLPKVRRLKRKGASLAQISTEVDRFLRATLDGLIDTAEEDVGHRHPRFSFDGVQGGGNLN